MDSQTDAFLYDVQVKARKLYTVCDMTGTPRSKELAGEIFLQIANYRQAQKMGQESTAPDRYDLNALPAPVAIDSEDDTESPDFEG